MNPLGIAVVGLGWWGRVIVPLAKTSAKLRVVAAADPDPAAAEFAAREQVPLARSYEEVLRHPQVQGVVLCTAISFIFMNLVADVLYILINIVVVIAMRRLERRIAVPGFIGGGVSMPQAGH